MATGTAAATTTTMKQIREQLEMEAVLSDDRCCLPEPDIRFYRILSLSLLSLTAGIFPETKELYSSVWLAFISRTTIDIGPPVYLYYRRVIVVEGV